MSDGQLLMRIRAYQREQTWAPPYVANELAGTRQAADRHRATATLRATAAEAGTHDAERAQLEQRAADVGCARPASWTSVPHNWSTADEARARWYAHTAATRAAADRAQLELAARRTGENPADDHITATKLGSGHDATRQTAEASHDRHDTVEQAVMPARRRGHQADDHDSADRAERSDVAEATERTDIWRAVDTELRSDDEHRKITDDADFADLASQREADRGAVNVRPDPDAAETAVRDIRDVSAVERRRDREDQVRVPSADETADAIRRAHRALAEIHAREAADGRRVADDARIEQLVRWHHEKHATVERTQDDSDSRGV